MVHNVVPEKGKKKVDKISHDWWVRFCKRWRRLRLRKGDLHPVVRDQATNYTIFKNYFDLLSETLTKHGIKDKLTQMYNCDDSGMPLECKMPKVITAKGTKKV